MCLYPKQKINIYLLVVTIVLLTSIAFVLTSTKAGELQKVISGSNNGYFIVMSSINNVIAFFIPVLLLTFFHLTSKIIAFILEIKIESNKINICISLGFIPIFISALVYSYLLSSLNKELIFEGITVNEIGNIYLFKNFTLNDYTYIGYFSWFIFFVIYSITLRQLSNISLNKIIVITTFPTILVLLIRFLFT